MASKKIPLPVPLDRWFKDIKSIDELRTLLASEAYQTAAATLKEVAGPSFSSLSADNNLRHAWYAGYRDAFADLEKLTKLPATTANQTNTEWMHITTESL